MHPFYLNSNALPFNLNPVIFLIMIFILALMVALITADYAQLKGRSSTAWFVLGLLFGFLALLFLYFLPSQKKNDRGLPTMTVMPPAESVKEEAGEIIPSYDRYKDENKLWYYLDKDHQQMGPVSLVGLRELWNTGLLELTTYVWGEGMEKWEKVDNLPDLKAALNKDQE